MKGVGTRPFPIYSYIRFFCVVLLAVPGDRDDEPSATRSFQTAVDLSTSAAPDSRGVLDRDIDDTPELKASVAIFACPDTGDAESESVSRAERISETVTDEESLTLLSANDASRVSSVISSSWTDVLEPGPEAAHTVLVSIFITFVVIVIVNVLGSGPVFPVPSSSCGYTSLR